jgi:hypothetical protein
MKMKNPIAQQYKELIRKPKANGKLVFMDQGTVGPRLVKDLGSIVKNGLYFDSVDLVDGYSSDTVVHDALTGKYTYEQLLKKAQNFFSDRLKSTKTKE